MELQPTESSRFRADTPLRVCTRRFICHIVGVCHKEHLSDPSEYTCPVLCHEVISYSHVKHYV